MHVEPPRPNGAGASARGVSSPREDEDNGPAARRPAAHDHLCSAAMPLDERTLSAAVQLIVIAVVMLALWLALLQRSYTSLRRRLRRLVPEGAGFDEVLDRQQTWLDDIGGRVDALNNLHHELEQLSQRSIQKVGVVRFNPFADTGGDQSFAIALLDAEGNGIVLSSLHSRSDTRMFAKQVQAGRSRHQLSDEEQDAIRKALAPAGA